jgi:hypothetical protein
LLIADWKRHPIIATPHALHCIWDA